MGFLTIIHRHLGEHVWNFFPKHQTCKSHPRWISLYFNRLQFGVFGHIKGWCVGFLEVMTLASSKTRVRFLPSPSFNIKRTCADNVECSGQTSRRPSDIHQWPELRDVCPKEGLRLWVLHPLSKHVKVMLFLNIYVYIFLHTYIFIYIICMFIF